MDDGWIDGLRAPEGRALLEALTEEDLRPENELRVLTRLRAHAPAPLATAALAQARLRLRARAKFAAADRMWLTPDGLEQASTDAMAAHHAARFAGLGRLADLCCGIGGDLLALARGHDVLAVDLDPVHLRLAALNAETAGVASRISFLRADVRDAPLDGVAGVFLDPARRIDGRRLPSGESEPPLAWAVGVAARVPAVGIKAGPALPLDRVAPGWEAEFVSERGELKEAMLWSPALAGAARRATLLPGGESLAAEDGPPVPVRAPGDWLLDPDPAVTRAGAVEALARRLGAWKIDDEVAFLSAAEEVRTPFARTLRVEASLPWNVKRLRPVLRERGIGTVDVRKRGSAADVDAVRKQLKLEGGGRRGTVVLTRVADRPWALVCTDP